jgi:drug/metabolite transporter (DMT)-like permease
MSSRIQTSAATAIVSPPASTRIALVALFAGSLALASSPIFVRLSETGPSATGFYRLLIGGLAMWSLGSLWLQPDEQRSGRFTRRDWGLLALAGLLFAADLVAWHQSILLTTVANATFLGNLAAVVVAAGSVLILRQRVGWRFLIALAVTIAGAAVLMGFSFRVNPAHLAGDALALLAALFYGAFFLVVASLRRAMQTRSVMLWYSLIGAAAILPYAMLAGERVLPASAEGWLWLLGIGLISQFAGQGLITYALAHLSAHFTSLGTFVQPVATAVLAWLLFAEAMGALQIAGCAIVLAGIWLAHRAGRVR